MYDAGLQCVLLHSRHKQINHARNIWDRAVTILPRVNQFWLNKQLYVVGCELLIVPYATGTSTHIWRKCWAMLLVVDKFLRDGWNGNQTNRSTDLVGCDKLKPSVCLYICLSIVQHVT